MKHSRRRRQKSTHLSCIRVLTTRVRSRRSALSETSVSETRRNDSWPKNAPPKNAPAKIGPAVFRPWQTALSCVFRGSRACRCRTSRNGGRRNFELFPVYCVSLYLLSLTHKQLQAGTAPTSVNPLYSSESSQHISIRNKNRNINGRTRNSEVV